jgi:hypothetical protein
MLSELICLVVFIFGLMLHIRELQKIEEHCPGVVITHNNYQPEVYNFTTCQFNVHEYYDVDD